MDRDLETALTPQFVRALEFALEVHAGQTRKGTTIPYVSHLLQVSGLVLEFGGSEREAIGALLHDAAEDAGGEATLQRIAAEFGHEVADIVRANSDSITESKDNKPPWHERKTAYIAAIDHKSGSACLVSICDKIHNARTLVTDSREIGESLWSRFNAARDDTLWYYRSLLEAFERAADREPRLVPAVHELRIAVASLDDSSTP